MGKKAAPKPNIGRVEISFIELFQRSILLNSNMFVKLNLLNLSIDWMGKSDIIKSINPEAKGIYFPNKNKLRINIKIEEIIKKLFIPKIMGIDISTPLNAFLDVVKIIVKVVIDKRRIDKSFLYLLLLFIKIKLNEKGHITESQVPA